MASPILICFFGPEAVEADSLLLLISCVGEPAFDADALLLLMSCAGEPAFETDSLLLALCTDVSALAAGLLAELQAESETIMATVNIIEINFFIASLQN
jgi:hypothetical protein